MKKNQFLQDASNKKQGKRSVFIAGVFLFVIGFLILIGLTIFGATRIASGLSSTTGTFDNIQVDLASSEFSKIEGEIPNIRLGLEEMSSGIKFLSWLKILPWVGDQVKGVDISLDVAVDMTHVAEDALLIMNKVVDQDNLDISFNDLPADKRELLLQNIKFVNADLQRVVIRTKVINAKLEELKRLNLHPVFKDVVVMVSDKFSEYSSVLDVVIPITAGVDEFAGLQGGAQWLVLFLDNETYKPSGGEIYQVGLVFMKNGQVQKVDFEPLTINDTYWLPDFSVVAERAADNVQLIAKEHGLPAPKVNAVVGITPDFLNEVAQIGSVNAKKLSFSNSGETAKVSQELLMTLYNFNGSELFQFLEIVRKSIQEKKLVVYSFSDEVQKSYDDASWSGRVEANYDDLLMVADANTSTASDLFLTRKTEYRITSNKNGYTGTVKINYFNKNREDWQGVTNILIKGQSVVTAGPAGFFSEDQGAYTRVAFTHSVLAGSEAEVEVTFNLSADIASAIKGGVYQLEVLKQIGVDAVTLTLDLDFGKKVRAAEPVESEEQFGDNKYYLNSILSQDTVFTVEL
ncbi:hypothetical protein COY25_04435 [Candidatus Uhrbacteria bacterium CG_4_10_14_0_2_um_filter_41_7]|uniref:DUF4012 domain-containing protein n=1 Tax=Candidatus Uhrbacteria bacterium CG_4_9_14_3_um_filter_41_35 TaxID=1975034 RepID=A0A2M7XDM0_9BACT|nr:MAG: hypothetical protein COV92_01960 [Candidatus Uhrbacteria bacterium CG11_big_fil_rev_8_21_14_0_20_41_9]PIZ52906.1 MAG: hypothetical protein COY25_04435 [Candidatus Uhrbacteria bacterium CG_4_10_14_0_2_um_filter_41_7]PJA45826.1 MAG: hypothetical protein CO173_04625 [Candidatus Uhrbacteria bacterium CG_4_9_14_3_um_filter_41_35]